MLGFTRHERLDVKKPGPPAAPPPIEVAAEKKSIVKEGNKEVLPAHLNSNLLKIIFLNFFLKLIFIFR